MLRRALLAATIAVGLYSASGFLLVPRVLRWAIEKKGGAALARKVTLGGATFNPFTLEAVLSDLRVLDRDRQPLLSFRRLDADFQISGVFRRAWSLSKVQIDGPVVAVRILRNGKLSIDDLLETDETSSGPPRLIIRKFALHGGRLDFADDSVVPAARAAFTPIDIEIADLVTLPDTEGGHAVTIGFGRGTTIRLSGQQMIEPLGISGRITANALPLPFLLDRFGRTGAIAVRNGTADVDLDYTLRRPARGGVQLKISRAAVTASNLAIAPAGAGASLLSIPRLEVRDISASFPEQHVEIGSLRVVDPNGAIGWNAAGRFNWSATAAAPQSPPAPPKAPPSAKPLALKIARAAIEGGTFEIDDARTTTPVRIELTGLAIEATDVTNDPHAPIAITAATAVNGGGRLSLHGTLVPSPFSLISDTTLSAIDLVPFRPYAAVPGLSLAAGSLGFDGRTTFTGAQPYLIEGNGALHGVELLDLAGQKLLGCTTASLRALRLDGASSRFRIRGIDLDGAYANVVIDKKRNLNLSTIGESGAPAKPAAAKAATQASGSFDIGVIQIRNSTIDYRDDSLVLPFATKISALKGSIADFSTTAVAAATIHLDGNVAEHGSMKAEGTLRASDPFAGTNLFVRFRSVPLPRLTPYAAEFAGYALERGSLDLDLHYTIINRKLTGDHHVVATDLTLGRKVSGSRAGFAVRLAVALLKDREGRIDLQVPIEGTVDSPEFDYRSVMWQAIKTILVNVVKAPFRALGRLAGIHGEKLDLVAFDPGDSTVIAPEAEKLAKLAPSVAERPELTFEIQGRYDPALDTPALQTAKLEAAIAARRDAPAVGATEPPALEAILEALYGETFSPAALAAERARFTKTIEPAAATGKQGHKAGAPPETHFDAPGFYDALRSGLVQAQKVSTSDLEALASARAAAITSVLVSKGLPATQLRTLTPATASRQTSAQQVASDLKLSAGDPGADESHD